MQNKVVEIHDKQFVLDIARAFFALSIVRKHNAGEIDLYKEFSKKELWQLVRELGVDEKELNDVYTDRTKEKLGAIRKLLGEEDFYSAVLLLSAFIEREINEAIRVCLRMRNYSHGKITDAIKGTTLAVKINTLLPLLEVEISERQRQISLDLLPIRNEAIHFKGVPRRMGDFLEHPDSEEVLLERANHYFRTHPIDVIEEEFEHFFDYTVSGQPHVSRVLNLIKEINS